MFTGLCVGLSPKDLSVSDSVRSPKSPLDLRVCNSERSHRDRSQMSWDNSKVGLSIVDSLVDDFRVTRNILRSSESKNILFGSRLRIGTLNCPNHIYSFRAPTSLPKSFALFPPTHTKSRLRKGNPDVVFEITDSPLEPECGKVVSCSLDSGMSFVVLSLSSGLPNCNLNSDNLMQMSGGKSTRPHSANEIELSEDYTCVTSHGSRPKTTRIYNDCILESRHTEAESEFANKEELPVLALECPEVSTPYLSCDFLCFCYSCNTKLEEGKDIHIYRGEKAFCSSECRWKEILMGEQLEKSIEESSKKFPEFYKEEDCLNCFPICLKNFQQIGIRVFLLEGPESCEYTHYGLETPFTAAAPPMFMGENYQVWAIRMEAYLDAIDLWEAVEEDYEVPPLPNNPTVAQIKSNKERRQRKSKAKACLFAVVSPSIFTRIMTLKRAKSIWDFLKEEYEGDDRVKGSRHGLRARKSRKDQSEVRKVFPQLELRR